MSFSVVQTHKTRFCQTFVSDCTVLRIAEPSDHRMDLTFISYVSKSWDILTKGFMQRIINSQSLPLYRPRRFWRDIPEDSADCGYFIQDPEHYFVHELTGERVD